MKKELKMFVDAGRKSGKIKNADMFTLTSDEIMSIALHKGFTLKEATDFYLNYFDTDMKTTMIMDVSKRIKDEKEAYIKMVEGLEQDLCNLRDEETSFKIKKAMKARPDIYEFAYQDIIGIEFDGTEYDEPDIVDAPFYHGDRNYFKDKGNKE